MPVDWTDIENDIVVANYFEMLALDLAGQTYNKALRNRTLQTQIKRTHGSIEFKNQNISAVLKGLGEDWLLGYKPAFNFQSSLVDAVVRWLDSHGEWIARVPVRHTSTRGYYLQEERTLWIGPPPTQSNQLPPNELERMSLIAQKFDVAARDARNRALGRLGEEMILTHEDAVLRGEGRPDLAREIRWVAEVDGDGAGYDIRSFTADGRERLIEVKTTNGWDRTPFYLTRNEVNASQQFHDDWALVRLWNFSRTPRAFEIRPPLQAHLSLIATTYQATVL